MFRVVPDQLRISEGWVRCGHCSEVFDASGHMQTMVHQPDPGGPPGKAPETVPPEDPPPQSVVEAPVSSGAMLVSATSVPGPNPRDDDDLNAVFRPGPVRQEPGETSFPSAAAPTVPESILDEDVSFVREARRKAFWRRPIVRLPLMLVAVLLVVVLALQVAVHDRDRLATLEPQLKPWLALLCAQIGCTVDVPRQIESVVIDSSTFNKVRSDSFRLSFTVRNTAGVEVATPAVELTLTDTQDQAVIRRVFVPGEIGASAALSPRGEWNAVIHIGVATAAEGSRVAGYRLLAFYP
jgi:predicted Zn finger-like uncharacterized protein